MSNAKPTKAAEKPKPLDPKDVVIPGDVANTTYFQGKNPYRPRAAHNARAWGEMQTALTKAGDKGVKGSVLAKALLVNDKHPDKTHFDFIGYLERRGALRSKA